jgi:hypothetical protein
VKKHISILILAFTCFLSWQAGAQITSTNILFSPALPAGTNYSAIYLASGTLRIMPLNFQFQNGGLNATNALYWPIQIAIGNTNNFSTATIWYHSGTNYTIDIDSTNFNALPVYFRILAVNTNASTTIPGVSANIIHQ